MNRTLVLAREYHLGLIELLLVQSTYKWMIVLSWHWLISLIVFPHRRSSKQKDSRYALCPEIPIKKRSSSCCQSQQVPASPSTPSHLLDTWCTFSFVSLLFFPIWFDKCLHTRFFNPLLYNRKTLSERYDHPNASHFFCRTLYIMKCS